MATNTLVWTLLPNGMRRDSDGDRWRAHVSAFVSPRLKGGQTLAQFPPFLDWPATLAGALSAGMTFEMAVEGHNSVALSLTSQPDRAAWQAILGPDTKVRDIGPSKTLAATPNIEHYDGVQVSDAIRRVYGQAVSGGQGRKTARLPALDAFRIVDNADTGTPLRDDGRHAIHDFIRFHQAAAGKAKPGLHNDLQQSPDFHEVIAACGAHPPLLRRLGLVLEFEFDAAALPADNSGGEALIRLLASDGALPGIEQVSYWTRAQFDVAQSNQYRVFRTAERAPEVGADEARPSNDTAALRRQLARTASAGLFPMDAAHLRIAQERLEHAAFGLLQHAGRDTNDGLPALQQGGMRLIVKSLPDRLLRSVAQQSALAASLAQRQSGLLGAAPDEQVIYADAITRGYRIDVRNTSGGPWRSLCRRRSRYRAGDWVWPDAQDMVEDEGFVEPTAFTDDHAVDNFTLRTTQDMFEWDGWSLCVPESSAATNESTKTGSGAAPLQIDSRVSPGSLQPLRFGHCYEFRARTVDIAGNSLTLEEANAVTDTLDQHRASTSPTCYLRVESAKPPVVFRAQSRGPGEAGDVIVIRDAEQSRYRTVEFGMHVFPPQVPLRMAQRHGVFDGMPDDDAWRLIETHRGELGCDSNGQEREFLPWGDTYTPYLPDPMVTRALLTLPDGQRLTLPAFDELPEAQRGRELARSCRLLITAGNNEFQVNEQGRTVSIAIPKGRRHTLRLNAHLNAQQLATCALAHTDWQRTSVDTQALQQAAQDGEAPELAPPAELTVIHTTQRPLIDPVWVSPALLAREPNATAAVLIDDKLIFDAPSSGRLDVYARWQDPVDDPRDPGWRVIEHQMHAGDERVGEDDSAPFSAALAGERARAPLTHDFNDTKHHEVSYVAVATSRFIEFYPRSLSDDPDNMTRRSSSVTLHVPGTAPPAAPDIAYVIPTLKRTQQGQRQTQGGYGLRVYMNRGWFSSGSAEQLALVLPGAGAINTDNAEVSSWGVNPLRDSAPLRSPLGAQHITSGTALNDTLVLHDVRFSEEHGLPFADIEFATQEAFMPLVRLALARYQPYAIENCHLSPVSMAQFVPLTPERTLSLSQTSRNAWRATLTGASYRHTGDTVKGTVTSVVEARVECQSSDKRTEDAAWQPIGAPITLEAVARGDWQYLWQGEIRIGDAHYLSDRWRRRLVIQEYEPFEHPGLADVPLADYSRLISAHTVLI